VRAKPKRTSGLANQDSSSVDSAIAGQLANIVIAEVAPAHASRFQTLDLPCQWDSCIGTAGCRTPVSVAKQSTLGAWGVGMANAVSAL
jgi:hypothetical protein